MLFETSAFNLPIPNTADGDWCVYLILCANGALYCGISNHPEQRFVAHMAGKGARYTRMHKPIEMRLVYKQLFRAQATQIEKKIKKLNAAQKRLLWTHLSGL